MKTEIEISYQGQEYTVEYILIEGDDAVPYYPDGSGYPGSPDSLEIKHIWDVDLNEVTTTLCHSDIEEIILSNLIN
jgi:hypothetical protein